MLSLAAAASASLFIVTKYGLVRVLRMSDTPTVWPLAEEAPPEDPAAGALDELEELQAARAAAQRAATVTASARRWA